MNFDLHFLEGISLFVSELFDFLTQPWDEWPNVRIFT